MRVKILVIFLLLSTSIFANNYPLFLKEDITIGNKEQIIEWLKSGNTKEFRKFYFGDIDNVYNLKSSSLLKYQTQKENLIYLVELHSNFFHELFSHNDPMNSEYSQFFNSDKLSKRLVFFLLWFYNLNNAENITNDELKEYRKECKKLQESKIASNFIMGLAITLPHLAKKVKSYPNIEIKKVKKYMYQLGVYIRYKNDSDEYANLNIVNEFILFDGFRSYELDHKAMVKSKSAITPDFISPYSSKEGDLIFYDTIYYRYNYTIIYKPLMSDNYYSYQIFDIDSVKRFADFRLNF